MSILNRPSDGLLSVLIALRSGLLAYGPKPETELLELVAPVSVVADGKPDMAKKTLTRWKQLGFFQEMRGAVVLSPSIASIAADDTDGLRSSILRLVLLLRTTLAYRPAMAKMMINRWHPIALGRSLGCSRKTPIPFHWFTPALNFFRAGRRSVRGSSPTIRAGRAWPSGPFFSGPDLPLRAPA